MCLNQQIYVDQVKTVKELQYVTQTHFLLENKIVWKIPQTKLTKENISDIFLLHWLHEVRMIMSLGKSEDSVSFSRT